MSKKTKNKVNTISGSKAKEEKKEVVEVADPVEKTTKWKDKKLTNKDGATKFATSQDVYDALKKAGWE